MDSRTNDKTSLSKGQVGNSWIAAHQGEWYIIRIVCPRRKRWSLSKPARKGNSYCLHSQTANNMKGFWDISNVLGSVAVELKGSRIRQRKKQISPLQPWQLQPAPRRSAVRCITYHSWVKHPRLYVCLSKMMNIGYCRKKYNLQSICCS